MQVDLLKTAAQLSEVKHAIHAINGEAHIVQTQRSQVDLRRILKRGAYQGAQALTEGDPPASEPSLSDCQTDHSHQSGAGPHAESHNGVQHAAAGHVGAALQQSTHTHDSEVRTVAVREKRVLDLDRCGWAS